MTAVPVSTASDLLVRGWLSVSVDTGSPPVRTCIGCRRREAATELLRIVADRRPDRCTGDAGVVAVPDPRRRAAGRGAWVHPDPDCVNKAERRRAFDRALRVPGPIDPAPVWAYVVALGSAGSTGQRAQQ